MATIVGRRGNGVEVGLAVSPPVVFEDDDTSPHIKTWQMDCAKPGAGRSELTHPHPVMNDGVADEDFPRPPVIDDDCDEGQEGEDGDADLALTGEMHQGDDPPSYIPSHLYEQTEPDASPVHDYGHEEKALDPPYPSDMDGQCGVPIISEDSLDEGHPAVQAGDVLSGQTPPTGYPLHKRAPSSSIPHLLFASNSFTADPQQLMEIQSQLSFVMGVGPTSPSLASMGSRHESLAFSVDGDDAAFKGGPMSSQVGPAMHTQSHLGMNMKQGIPSSLECGSNLSSSASLASFVSPSQSMQFASSITPTNVSGFASPPDRVAMATQNMSLGMPQLNEPPSSIDNLTQGEGKSSANVLSIGDGPPHVLPMQNQPVPTRYPMPSAAQPVLYSAINSLERYNAGSFDNKVMLAKARGTYGRQRAFPGVPRKKFDQMSLGSSMDSKMSKCSSIDEEDGRIGRQTEQVGAEQLVSIMRQPSESKLHKSKSSGNLSTNDKGGPKRLEDMKAGRKGANSNRVTINEEKPATRRRRREKKKPMGVFRPSSDAYTPRMGNRDIKYKPAEKRESVEKMSSTMGTIQRPNFRDALRRVAIILHQHIVKIERRFGTGKLGVDDTGLFKASMREHFNEDNFATPRYKCSMVRVPMARPGVVYSMRKIRVVYNTPTTDEIYEFAHQLFKKVQLSSECSIVCLIYVEKLMEVAKVPLVAETWRPIFMCGLLLASKVWQDLSSWNIEFASVYPQFSLEAINRLELSFLKFIKWDLYISSSLYAKYYFALRSLLEKSGFRDRYNQMVGGVGGIAAAEAMKVAKRSEAVKEEALLQLSRSM